MCMHERTVTDKKTLGSISLSLIFFPLIFRSRLNSPLHRPRTWESLEILFHFYVLAVSMLLSLSHHTLLLPLVSQFSLSDVRTGIHMDSLVWPIGFWFCCYCCCFGIVCASVAAGAAYSFTEKKNSNWIVDRSGLVARLFIVRILFFLSHFLVLFVFSYSLGTSWSLLCLALSLCTSASLPIFATTLFPPSFRVHGHSYSPPVCVCSLSLLFHLVCLCAFFSLFYFSFGCCSSYSFVLSRAVCNTPFIAFRYDKHLRAFNMPKHVTHIPTKKIIGNHSFVQCFGNVMYILTFSEFIITRTKNKTIQPAQKQNC